MAYKYIPSTQVRSGYDFIKDIVDIDLSVFDDSLQGTPESIRTRYERNKDSYILAYYNFEIIGYVCFFPITGELSTRVQNESKTFDDDIRASDIVSYEEIEGNRDKYDLDIFIISTAVVKEHRGKGVGKGLMAELFASVSDKIQNGYRIKNIFSYTSTNAGAWLLDRVGFAEQGKPIKIAENGSYARLMHYKFDDFKESNMYLFVPFFVDVDNHEIDSFIFGEKANLCVSKIRDFMCAFEGDKPLSDEIEQYFSQISEYLFDISFDENIEAAVKVRSEMKAIYEEKTSALAKLLLYVLEIDKCLMEIDVRLADDYKNIVLDILDPEGHASYNTNKAFDEMFTKSEIYISEINNTKDENFEAKQEHIGFAFLDALKCLLKRDMPRDGSSAFELRKAFFNIIKLERYLSSFNEIPFEALRNLKEELNDILKINLKIPKRLKTSIVAEYKAAFLHLAEVCNTALEYEKISLAEFDNKLSGGIKRTYLGRDELIFVDEYKNFLPLDKEFDLSVFYYGHFYIAVLKFRDLDLDPTRVLNQASMDKIIVSNKGEERRKQAETQSAADVTTFSEYFAKKIGVEDIKDVQRKYTQAGAIRSLTSLARRPLDIHLAYMMACESYTGSEYITHRLTAKSFYDRGKINLAQYNTSLIYASEKNVVYIVDDPAEDRQMHESLMYFIMELLMLQLCAISSVYEEVIYDLHSEDFSHTITEQINRRISQAAQLWDVDAFVYLASKNIHTEISNEFGIPRLKEDSKANLDVFEELALVEAQKETAQIQRLISMFTFASGISALNVFVGILIIVFMGEATTETRLMILIYFMIFVALSVYVLVQKSAIKTKFANKVGKL